MPQFGFLAILPLQKAKFRYLATFSSKLKENNKYYNCNFLIFFRKHLPSLLGMIDFLVQGVPQGQIQGQS
jgi:hypothetical protein